MAVGFHRLIDSVHVQACTHRVGKQIILLLPVGQTGFRDGGADGYTFAHPEPGSKAVYGFRRVEQAVKIRAEDMAFYSSVLPAV